VFSAGYRLATLLTLLWVCCFVRAAQKPVWEFKVDVRVSPDLAVSHRGLGAVREKVEHQFREVNRLFNVAGAFEGEIRFSVASLTILNLAPLQAVYGSPSPNSFQLIYDNKDYNPWYFPDARTVLFGWPDNYFGGPFSAKATESLVHEFGHARGAIDLYGLNVLTQNNPIAPLGYTPEPTVMSVSYGTTLWDEHSRGLINAAGATPQISLALLRNSFPRQMRILARDEAGRSLPNATVRLYPVEWYSEKVSTNVVLTGQTDASGLWVLPVNPFQPGTPGKHWQIAYPNFLVEVQAEGKTGYEWLPLTFVQSACFAAPERPFTLLVETTPIHYGEWIAARLPNASEGERAGPADPDGDGLPNDLEYVYRLNPSQRSKLWQVPACRELRLTLPTPRSVDMDCTVQTLGSSQISGEWAPVMTELIPTSDGFFRLSPLRVEATQQFFRVQVDSLY